MTRSLPSTGIGSHPGTDPREATHVVMGELDLPHLVELPARGPHADLVGRAVALLVDLPVDLQPNGFRLVDRPGGDLRRCRDLLGQDLDALEEVAADRAPLQLKVQVAGPLTLAALLDRPRGDRVLADSGARRDLAASLAEGAAAHVREVARRTGAEVVLQVDEPALPAVLAGAVPTASGFGRLRAVEEPEAVDALRGVLSAGSRSVVHCCAGNPPVGVVRRAGASGISVAADALPSHDELAAAVEAGIEVWLGLVPTTGGVLPEVTEMMSPVHALLRTGLEGARLREALVVTPTCGLAGTSPHGARAAMAAATAVARAVAEELA